LYQLIQQPWVAWGIAPSKIRQITRSNLAHTNNFIESKYTLPAIIKLLNLKHHLNLEQVNNNII
jgi:hypothetical protein